MRSLVACTAMPSRPLVLGHRGASHASRRRTPSPPSRVRARAGCRRRRARRAPHRRRRAGRAPRCRRSTGSGCSSTRPFAELRAARPVAADARRSARRVRGLARERRGQVPAVGARRRPRRRGRARGRRPRRERATLDVVISSFDLGAVDAVRDVRARARDRRGSTHGQDRRRRGRGRAAAHGHEWLHPDRAAVLAAPDAARRPTCTPQRPARRRVDRRRSRRDARRSPRAGVDAIITNVPDVALATLRCQASVRAATIVSASGS